MNRRNQRNQRNPALQAAPAASRELLAILESGTPVILGGRRLRSGLALDYPAQVQAAQVLAAQAAVQAQLAPPEEQKGPPDEQKGPPDEQKGPPDEDDDEERDERPDRDEFEAANRQDPMQEVIQNAEREYEDILRRYERMLQLRLRTASYRRGNIGEQLLDTLEKWKQDYEARGLSEGVIDGIIFRQQSLFERFSLVRDELARLREERRDPVERAEADYHRILQKYEDEAKRSGLPNIANRVTQDIKEWERLNRERGIPLDRLQDIVDRVVNEMAERYPNIVRADEYQEREEEEDRLNAERQAREEKESAEYQAKRNSWARLEAQGEKIPRNTWLSGGARLLREIGIEPPDLIADLPIVNRQMGAMWFVNKFWVKPQIKDWRKCQKCAFVLENGERCKRYASCHRTNPSNTYCWEHARKSGLNYERRIGLVD
jgi:hypothetical protein